MRPAPRWRLSRWRYSRILAATDANPRWLKFGDDYINGLRRLQRAPTLRDERVKTYQAEWFSRLFVFRWDVKGEDDAAVPFSQEACRAYLLETDDVIPAIQRTAFDNQNFRGAKVEVVVGEGKGSSSGGAKHGADAVNWQRLALKPGGDDWATDKLLEQPDLSAEAAPYWAVFEELSPYRPKTSLSLGLGGGVSFPDPILAT